MREHTITTPVAPAQLAAELAAALGLAEPPPVSARAPQTVDGQALAGVVAVPDDLDPAKVQAVIDAHVPAPPPDLDAEFRKAVEAATSLAALKDALLGKAGPGAEPRQPTGR
jgi:hypothetical protein